MPCMLIHLQSQPTPKLCSAVLLYTGIQPVSRYTALFFFFFFLFCFLALNATPTRSNALWLQSVQTAGSADNPSLAQTESTRPGLPANAPGRWAEITAPCAISPRPAPCASAALTASISVLACASRHVAKVSNPSVMASMGVNALNARPSSLRKI